MDVLYNIATLAEHVNWGKIAIGIILGFIIGALIGKLTKEKK
jgi:uncharacterized membrane-anchored protein YhcB (DUF1043 family)